MYTCSMATKTISIDLEAYERLRLARLSPDESFSRVIKRARWRDERKTAAELLRALQEVPRPDPAVLERLDEAQRTDAPPEDPWRSA
jgi:predicted CopG family antitoxin